MISEVQVKYWMRMAWVLADYLPSETTLIIEEVGVSAEGTGEWGCCGAVEIDNGRDDEMGGQGTDEKQREDLDSSSARCWKI